MGTTTFGRVVFFRLVRFKLLTVNTEAVFDFKLQFQTAANRLLWLFEHNAGLSQWPINKTTGENAVTVPHG